MGTKNHILLIDFEVGGRAMKLKKLIKRLKRKTRNISSIREVNYDTLMLMLRNNSSILLIDVRRPQEYAENRINSAINIPEYEINSKIIRKIPNKNTPIILYCQSGIRSTKSYKNLEKLGYTNLYNLKGGLDEI